MPPAHAGRRERGFASVTVQRTPGRAYVSRRAVADLVRTATLGSYGVTGFAAALPLRIAGAVGVATPGIRLALRGRLEIDLDITVAHGLPIAEVARQVDSAVRYAIRRALGREVDRLTIHVGGLRLLPSIPPGAGPASPAPPATAATQTIPDPQARSDRPREVARR
jgi:uncharacterized alkaline shock family protein YloU